MAKKLKNDGQLTAHMPTAYIEAIQNLSLSADISASEWLRDAAKEKLDKQLLQAKSALEALKSIEIYKLSESYESGEEYDDD